MRARGARRPARSTRQLIGLPSTWKTRRVLRRSGIERSAATPRLVRWTVRHASSVFASGELDGAAVEVDVPPLERERLGGPRAAVGHEHDQRPHRPHSSATRSTSANVKRQDPLATDRLRRSHPLRRVVRHQARVDTERVDGAERAEHVAPERLADRDSARGTAG